MTIGTRCCAVVLGVGLFVAGPAVYAGGAPPSAVSASQMDDAVARGASRDADARAGIQALLQRDDVKAMAVGYGLDLRRAEAAVGTLEGAELQSLAAQAAQADAALAGGEVTLRIGLVAALLIVIIVILIAG